MPIDDLTALGLKMREARKNKELTQQELSDLSHVSVKQIANIEKGKMNPSYLILRALAKVLHISLDTLINPDISLEDEGVNQMKMLFDKQYILTETVETEIRYRPETRHDEDGDPYTVQVPYEYTICTVTLENFDLSHVPVYVMSEDQLALYASYMATLGNRPDLFGDSDYVNRYYGNGSGGSYDIPPEALEDEAFAAIIKEAEKYLGFPYVWGGSSPATSFDCSGFVSYVYNNCGVGWIFGRLSAEGIRQICSYVSPADAKPGDLIFFEKTYNTTGASHIGIYVGNHTMLHCGDPIQYTSISSDYWQSHFLQFGRLAPP